MENLIGQKFGRLTVISFEGIKNGHYYYLCQCECGNIKTIEKGNLKYNRIKSCGCLKKEKDNLPKKHGKSYTRLYHIYYGMIARCYNKKDKSYKNYGYVGITVCKEWKDNFMNFYNWAINNGYQDNLTIDRINVNGNYEPSNCKWSNPFEQANNKKNNYYLTYKNEKHSISEWARILNCSRGMIRGRLKRGLSIEQILGT